MLNTGASSMRGIQTDQTYRGCGFRFIQFVLKYNTELEEVGQFIVKEFIPQLETLHHKYVFGLQDLHIFE